MPEGHTLHRLAADYRSAFAGRLTSSSSPQGRFVIESTVLDGRELIDAWAYGKHLFCRFGPQSTMPLDAGADQDRRSPIVHVHLGLLGKAGFQEFPQQEPAVVGAVRWRLRAEKTTGGGVVADLRGPTVCELLTPEEVEQLLARLGPDPLRYGTDPMADPERGWQRIRRSVTPIAVLLMDQRVAPGVGNIYRAEVLFRHRIDPMTAGRLLKHQEWQAIWNDLVNLMHEGVRTGRIDTVRPEHEPQAMGRPAREDPHGGEVYVYRRSGLPCLVCGTAVRIKELAGRNLFWCPRCQRIGRQRGRPIAS